MRVIMAASFLVLALVAGSLAFAVLSHAGAGLAAFVDQVAGQ
jgi:uncharacterized membrane protein YtjA (UPF0391 family)